MNAKSAISVLVVEDEALVSQSVQDQLKRMGFHVAGSAYNALEAVLMAKELRPSVIIMDMKMPDPDSGFEDPEAGLNATAQIQQKTPTAVVLLTAFESPDLVEKASSVGVGAYLLKPAKDNDLDRAITVAIARFKDLHRLGLANTELRREIQKRRKAQNELARSESLFRALAESAPLGIFLLDGMGHFVYLSPHGSEIVGFPSKEASSYQLFDLVHPDDRETTQNEYFRAIWEGRPWFHTHRILTKDGKLKWVRVHVAPLRSPNGSATGCVGTMDDITERKRIGEMREQSRRRESLAALAGALAHDLNNMLGGIQGNLELSRMHALQGMDITRHLDSIQESMTRAGELAKQMLSLSGHGHFSAEPVSLREVIQQALESVLRDHPTAPKIELDVTEEPLSVLGQSEQLKHVFQILLVNAIEAIREEPGSIQLRAVKLQLESDTVARLFENEDMVGGSFAVIEIRDSGIGMDAKTLSRCFDPFFTTKFVGRGMGLTMALGILKAHEGAILAESEPGKGTLFTIYLPAVQAPEKRQEEVPPTLAKQEPQKGKILLVDDEPILRESVSELLEVLGFDVVEAVDGMDALDKFKTQRQDISVVLMDLTMPRMDGREAFLAMRDVDPNVKVILSSGYSEQDSTRHIIGSGLAAFLQKPYRLKDLEAVLARVLA